MQHSATPSNQPMIGVGLRHPHVDAALDTPAPVDFVEVHSENYFAQGGALHSQLKAIAEIYPLSLHSTALGLGSASGIPSKHLFQLQALVQLCEPILISDHAAFAWGQVGDKPVHAGDLLPLVYDQQGLNVMARNVDKVQQALGKRLLVENLSAYITLPNSSMTEAEFLVRLAEQTDCGLLVDLNNLLVNAVNAKASDPLQTARAWIDHIPQGTIGELHLAGYTTPPEGELVIDDHASPVSADCWELYRYALRRHGAVPTLIEWDNQLPPWHELIAQARQARKIAAEVFANG